MHRLTPQDTAPGFPKLPFSVPSCVISYGFAVASETALVNNSHGTGSHAGAESETELVPLHLMYAQSAGCTIRFQSCHLQEGGDIWVPRLRKGGCDQDLKFDFPPRDGVP